MVAEATVMSDTFSKIHSILNNNVNSITDSSNNTVTLKSTSNNYWLGAYPTVNLDDKSSYPVGIIHTPTNTRDQEGFRLRGDFLQVEIEVLALKAEHSAKFIQKALSELENKQDTLTDDRLESFEISRTENDIATRGDIQLHSVSGFLDFEFYFTN